MSSVDDSAFAVDIQGLRKSYGQHEVLKGIDLQVKPGEVIAIIGKSGSGKSTLLERVAITRALAMQPAVRRAAESLATEGMTLPMVTHEMNFARKVADRVVFMHQGLVHEIGAPEVLLPTRNTGAQAVFERTARLIGRCKPPRSALEAARSVAMMCPCSSPRFCLPPPLRSCCTSAACA